MRENDGRKLSKAAREQLRITSVKRVVENGEKATDVIKSIGFQTCCIFRWLSAYYSGGYAALKDNQNHGGRPPKLTRARLFQLYKIIVNDSPGQYQA
jgi:transposase